MIKEALQYLEQKFQAANEPVEAHGCMYSPVELNLIKAPETKPLVLHTLQGLVDYIRAQPMETASGIIHVLAPEKVNLILPLNEETRQRETLITVELLQSAFQFGRYLPQEEFIVSIQSQFIQTEARDALIKVAGSITAEAVTISEDDGISQRVTAKAGIARVEKIDLPNPVVLKPYRTFIEVDQPEVQFVLRMRAPAQLALFEADGGAWRNKAITSIAYWLNGALQGKNMPVIA